MGRRRKYFTDEEKKEANRAKVLRYYWNNKEECDRKARERYLAKKLSYANNGASGSAEQKPPEEPKLQPTQEQSVTNEQ
jgi:hypothetical protein